MRAEEVEVAIRTVLDACPLVDNHCHNLVSLQSAVPYRKFFVEASGEGLLEGVTSVPFKVRFSAR